MKTVFTFFVFSVLFNCTIYAQEPTSAGIPAANSVLVVYNSNSDSSLMIKNYYCNARGIPNPLNVVGLPLPDSIEITIDNLMHWVGIRQSTDNIRDLYNHSVGTWYATEHAWKYFYENIAVPIKQHLINNNLLQQYGTLFYAKEYHLRFRQVQIQAKFSVT